MSLMFAYNNSLADRELISELADLKEKIYELEVERKRQKKIINQLKSLSPKINEPMLLTDIDGKIVDVNHQFINLLGYTLFDLKRMTIRSITPMNLHENETNILVEELSENKVIESRWSQFYKINGEKLSVQLTVLASYDDDGKLDGITRIVKTIL